MPVIILALSLVMW